MEGNTLPLAGGWSSAMSRGLLPGQFGIRIEDTVVCTADGGRR